MNPADAPEWIAIAMRPFPGLLTHLPRLAVAVVCDRCGAFGELPAAPLRQQLTFAGIWAQGHTGCPETRETLDDRTRRGRLPIGEKP